MNNGSKLLGWDDSPMNVMGTLVSRLELGSLEINLGMAWVRSLEDYTKKDNKLSAMVILIVIKKLASNDALLRFV